MEIEIEEMVNEEISISQAKEILNNENLDWVLFAIKKDSQYSTIKAISHMKKLNYFILVDLKKAMESVIRKFALELEEFFKGNLK